MIREDYLRQSVEVLLFYAQKLKSESRKRRIAQWIKKEYFLYVKGKAVKVNEEIYRAYWRITEHEKYLQRKDWKYNVLPFSVFDYDGHFIDNIVDESIDIEKIVEVKMQIEELNKALATLTEEERDIITAIFFREESLRSIGERKNRSYQSIGKRRDKILEKLREILKDKI